MGSEYPGEPIRRGLWVEEPARRYRMPDPVRTAAVRAVIIASVTLTLSTITFYLTLTGSWLAFPVMLCSVAGVIVSTWGVLDVWITRQAWRQRHGVVSQPSSTARGRGPERETAAGRAAARGPVPAPPSAPVPPSAPASVPGQRATRESGTGPRTAQGAGTGQPRPLRRA
ncbi:hypothetical protein [Streptomyces sp. NPDC089799]|uniref:hypothetical protein n=1 Tax=Streptomyces sp. NPDC089799 TaxID=3155066 RepID=UPI00341B9D0C